MVFRQMSEENFRKSTVSFYSMGSEIELRLSDSVARKSTQFSYQTILTSEF